MEQAPHHPDKFNIATVQVGPSSTSPGNIPTFPYESLVQASREEPTQPDQALLENFERQHFVRETPEFADQVDDDSRQNTFRYARMPQRLDNFDPPTDAEIVSMTEHEGLAAIDNYLATAVTQHLEWDGDDLAASARAIRENLSFIGEKEYVEGTNGLGQLWRSYLESDSTNQLCLLAGVSQNEMKRKSDQHLIEQVLAGFSDDELVRYGGRIVTSMDALIAPPDKAKILLVDDWAMSGSQLKAAVLALSEDERHREYLPSVEVNLIAASPQRIERGLTTPTRDGEVTVPVKAFFRTHDQRSSSPFFLPGEMPVTGTHSSGDYGFEQVIDRIVSAQRANGYETEMPPLTNVVREYRDAEPSIIKDPHGRLRHAMGRHAN